MKIKTLIATAVIIGIVSCEPKTKEAKTTDTINLDDFTSLQMKDIEQVTLDNVDLDPAENERNRPKPPPGQVPVVRPESLSTESCPVRSRPHGQSLPVANWPIRAPALVSTYETQIVRPDGFGFNQFPHVF